MLLYPAVNSGGIFRARKRVVYLGEVPQMCLKLECFDIILEVALLLEAFGVGGWG